MVSKEIKKEIKEIEIIPMDDTAIKKYLPHAKIITYDKLKNMQHIDQLIPEKRGSAVLLYLYEPNSGHWTGISKYADKHNNKIFEYFDSLGNSIDKPLTYVNPKKLQSMGIHAPYLTNIVNNSPEYKLKENNVKYQSHAQDCNCCGRHVCFRDLLLNKDNMTLEDYHNFMQKLKNKYKMNYDQLVSVLI